MLLLSRIPISRSFLNLQKIQEKSKNGSIVEAEKKMMTTKVFNGANVFMSRNLVPPEQFDALHDALKLNGAQVFLCCDPSRNAPTDYHVIASPQHVRIIHILHLLPSDVSFNVLIS